MHLTWHGQYTVRIQSADKVLVLDPYSPKLGLSAFRARADIVALTNPSGPDMANLSGLQGEPLVIASPGEYTIGGFTLNALGWFTEAGGERSLHVWRIEDVALLHVGALNRPLTDKELQVLEKTGIDVLLVPVGGGSGLNTQQALAMVTTIEPRLVIPIHWQLAGLRERLEGVDQFAKEMGVNPKQRETKVIIKSNKLPAEDVQTIILTA